MEMDRALLEAVSAYARGDGESVANILREAQLTSCLAILGLGAIVVEALRIGGALSGEPGVVAGVTTADEAGEEAAQCVAAVVAAIANGDDDGAHEVCHSLSAHTSSRVVADLIAMAAGAMAFAEKGKAAEN